VSPRAVPFEIAEVITLGVSLVGWGESIVDRASRDHLRMAAQGT
jgi:hypothetical protein